MKNYFKLLCCFVLVGTLFFSVACKNGVLIWADNSVTQTNGIDVKVLENTKKQFIIGQDDDNLVALYSSYGELTTFNIEISGKTNLESLQKTTTGMITNQKGIGEVSKNQSESDYYADLFKIKIYLPKNATFVNFLDKRGDILIDKPTMVEDTYLKQNIEFVRLNKAKTEINFNVNNSNNDAYYFVEFKDQNKVVLERFFIHIIYNVNIG